MRAIAVFHTALLTVAVGTVFATGCAETPAPASAAQAASGEPPHPDTKAEPGNCNYYNYYHDESKNAGGAGKCTSDCDCDGMRSCKSGSCAGEARAKVDCNSPDRHWNEAWNPQGPGKCSTDCECDGKRTCQAGACQGTAR
jgi:hypothetical protein